MYKIFLTKQAEKEYAHLYKTDRSVFERIRKALHSIAKEPRQGKPLKFELKGLWAYRVGMYRVIYRIEHSVLTVYVIDIGHRSRIYM